MLVNRLKSALFATATVGALFLGLASSASASVIINPNAAMGACGIGVVCQIGSGAAVSNQFTTNLATFAFTSDLIVQSLVGIGNTPNTVGSREVGSFVLQLWGGSAHGLQSDYNIYGQFSIAGNGHWSLTTPGEYDLDSVSPGGFMLVFDANPNTQTFPTFGQATQLSANGGILTSDPQDFQLASFFFNGFNGTPSAQFTGLGASAPSETINAALGMIPTAGTTGVNGFWVNVLPSGLNLSVGASASSNNNNGGGEIFQQVFANGSNGCTTIGGCVDLQTAGNFGPLFGGSSPELFGNGTVTFNVVSTPEPGTLSLFSMGLLGLGFMFRRRNESASKA